MANSKKKMNKTYLAAGILIVCALIVLGVAWGVGKQKEPESAGNTTSQTVSGKYYVQIDVEKYGSIIAELDADTAPITVQNFLKLVDEKFYDGLTFHRIISGFMIQGGDPNGDSTGGSSEKIKGEFAANGVENNISHVRGVLSMARSNAYDSASSQFFIMHADSPGLDGQYAAFGRVLSGMEVVDAICENTPVTDRNGSVSKANQPRITAITRIEKPAE